MKATRTIAIVGGGCSGTLCAARASRAMPEAAIVLYERAEPARGAAYSTRVRSHLLNVPAGRMSAFDEDPDHFLRWLRTRHPEARGTDFAARAEYGAYLSSILAEVSRLEIVRAEVTDLRGVPDGSGGIEVEAVGAAARRADRVILALGNAAPSDPCAVDDRLLASGRYRRNPWTALDDPAGHAIRRDDSVLLIGTGLTMVDLVLTLEELGHRGPIVACSRRGLLPHTHRAPHGPPSYSEPIHHEVWPRTARGYLHGVREAIAASGDDWRETINRLRPITVDLWQALPSRERRRFLDRLRPYWDAHRHRMAPEVAARLQRTIDEGRLSIVRAGARRLRLEGDRVVATLVGSGGSVERSFDRAINCTGPAFRVGDAHPLIARLAERGLVRLDDLHLGIDATPEGVALGRDGRPSSTILVIGPLLRGSRWETTAVPELRLQAARVAAVIAAGP